MLHVSSSTAPEAPTLDLEQLVMSRSSALTAYSYSDLSDSESLTLSLARSDARGSIWRSAPNIDLSGKQGPYTSKRTRTTPNSRPRHRDRARSREIQSRAQARAQPADLTTNDRQYHSHPLIWRLGAARACVSGPAPAATARRAHARAQHLAQKPLLVPARRRCAHGEVAPPAAERARSAKLSAARSRAVPLARLWAAAPPAQAARVGRQHS